MLSSCSGQGKTPRVPSNLQPAEGDDEEGDAMVDTVKTESLEDATEEPRRKPYVTISSGVKVDETCARTDGEPKPSGDRCDEKSHKSACSERVEKNRKEIVDAGMEVRKKRKKRASKKDVYYFFDTQSHVDNKVHFSELQCGVVTDDKNGYEQQVACTRKGKKKKKKLVLPSSSENEDEMFSHDDDGRNSLDAAAESATALLENSSIQEALDRDDSHGFESVPKQPGLSKCYIWCRKRFR